MAVVGFGLRRFWLRAYPADDRATRRADWGRLFLVALVAAGIGAVLIAIPLKAGIGMPDWPSQTYDAIFHLNAVQQVLNTGNASTLALNLSTPASAVAFYPAAWHGLTALVVQLTGAPIVVAANAMSFVIACVIWPVSSVYLARQLFGPSRLALLITGVLAAAFAAFPLLLVQYGVLYPYLLAIALSPIAIGLLLSALGKANAPDLEPPARWILFAWTLIGIGAAHPEAIFGLMVIAAPLVVQAVVEYLRRLHAQDRLALRGTVAVALTLLVTAACIYAWRTNGTTDSRWKPNQTIAQAIGEAIMNGTVERPASFVVSALMVIGMLVALRTRRHLWLVFAWALITFLYVVASAGPLGETRTALVGLWFNDMRRFAALLPLIALPLAALGGLTVIRWLQGALENAGPRFVSLTQPRNRSIAATTIAALVLVLLVPSTQGAPIRAAVKELKVKYTLSDESVVVSPDEIAVFADAARLTPPDAVIAGNPWNGSGLAYAYANRKVLFPHVSGTWSAERWEIADDLNTVTPGTPSQAPICQALRDEGVGYVLDFGTRMLHPHDERTTLYPGFDDIAASDAVTLVARHGDAALYQITACGLKP